MKTHIVKAAGAGLLSVLLGCGLHQDPFAGKNPIFQNGQGEKVDPIYEKPVRSDAIRFNAPNQVGFAEGKDTEFDVSARTLLPDYVTEIKIENMNEFPGAKYDAAAGKFRWRPPAGYVTTGGGSDGALERKLLVKATATKTGGPVLLGETEVVIRVVREYTLPEITLVRPDANVLREGFSMHIRVRVKDQDALDSDRTTWPEVQFTRVNNAKGLGSWIEPYGVSMYNRNEYEFDFLVNLQNAELTNSGTDFTTGIQALSRYGKRSAVSSNRLTVFTSLNQPVTSWSGTQMFKVGEKRTYEFMMFDQKQEAKLALSSWRNIPAGATVNCLPHPSNDSILQCSMEWEPKIDQAGMQDYIYAAVNARNRDVRDAAVSSFNLYMNYRVGPANLVSPTEGVNK